MLRRALLIAVMAAFAPLLPAQEEKNLTFNFKDASVDVVLKYVSSVTGWNFTFEPGAKSTGTITALSQTEVPLSKCLDFLNSALRQHGLVILNPYSPGLPKQGDTLKVLDVSKASGRSVEIHVGADPDAIPLTDQFRTQIIPLKAVNVVEVNKELGSVLQKAMGEGSTEVAISTYSNSIIMTGRCEGINRAARILRVIDVSASAELKIRVFALKNADALETAKTLNEVFKKETMRADTGRQNPMEGFMRMIGGGRDRGGESGGAGPSARALAHEMVRITAEQRTNSVIVSATEDNIKVIEDLIQRLDDKSAAVIKLKLYALRYADATTVAKLVNELFSDTPTNSSSQNRGGGGRNAQLPVWMGGQGGAQGAQGQTGATQDVRAVTDVRTNSILVAASEQKLVLIDAVMLEIDRQVNDMLIVKIYELKNADPVQMTTILQSLFRPQVTATQNAGRSTGGGGQQNQGGGLGAMMGFGGGNRGGGSSGSGQLLPSQEIDITNDPRTRAVIVKASRDYIAIVDEVVKQLDANPTETVSTFTYRMKNNDATTVGPMIQNLVRGTGSSTTGVNSGQNRTGQQGQGLFGGMQNQNQGAGSGFGNTQGGGGTRSNAGTSSTRGRNLGPLDPQDPPATAPQQGDDDLPRRGIEGQVDVQADPTTNMLVIRTSPRNFQSLQGILDELDRARPQVLIKVLIADVTLDHNTQFGLEGFWEDAHNIAGKKTTVNLGTDFNLPTTGLLTSFTNSVAQGHLNALAKEGKLRVLATPRILALDNQPALINVGKQVPRITNSQINQLGNTVNSVTYEDIGIQLLVTPHINPDGLVTMIVEPEVSDVASAAESVAITEGVNNPTFNVNRASTTVAVRNGTTVVIGGLIRETTDDAVDKVPILGDIPILGLAFSNTSKKKVKRELMIFLTPYVAYTQAQLEEISELERSRLKAIDPRDIDAESDRWLERVRR
ncbi:MAG TPA: secretin N-terminal domain-containing protein [Planctomycetota bacterium]|nr:secretin N-terminal domain-containing protein [Planctomycetota bacterium]